MKYRASIGVSCAFLLLVPAVALPGEARDQRKELVQWMVGMERSWAEESCGKPSVLQELLAADFHGTSPKGTRYDKPAAAPASDPATVHTDCRLLGAEVRFFGDNIAVIYGSETSVAPLPEGKHEQRCLVWTDTWLRRNGKWQIIAVQDARMECPVP